MFNFINTAYQQLLGTAFLELLAVVFSIVYLLLALKENSLCWYFALANAAIFTVIFWDVSLLMESALNVYYVVMAVYGWYRWRAVGSKDENIQTGTQVHTWPLTYHLLAWATIFILSAISGYWLSRNTSAVLPYLDSLTTWGSILTTWMVTRKVLENWLYWIVIDSVSIFLYIDRGLYLTSLLFVGYVIIVVFGYFSWRKRMQLNKSVGIEHVTI